MTGPGVTGPRVTSWLDGALVDSPLLPADDPALLTGEGVFETLAVRGGVPLALTRHLARLAGSAALLGIAAPDLAAARTGVGAVLAGGPDPGRLRLTWTGGGHLLVTLTALAPWAPTATVVTAPWPQPTGPLVGAKTTSYAAAALARRYARDRGADEALHFTADGRLAEGAASSVAVLLHGRLVTPPLSAGILPGVTRALLLGWGLAVEGELTRAQVEAATGIVLLSSTRDVHPVGLLDGRALGVVPLVSAAVRAFAARLAAAPDPG